MLETKSYKIDVLGQKLDILGNLESRLDLVHDVLEDIGFTAAAGSRIWIRIRLMSITEHNTVK